jgi:hypothetical protein
MGAISTSDAKTNKMVRRTRESAITVASVLSVKNHKVIHTEVGMLNRFKSIRFIV